MKRICASLLFVALVATFGFAQGPPTGVAQLFNLSTSPPTMIAQIGLDDNGNYSFSRNDLPQGTYNVQVHYTGGGQYLPSDSSPVAVTVNPPSLNTSTTLTVAPNPSTFGQTVVFSGSVTQP
jgi:hypothetical protein